MKTIRSKKQTWLRHTVKVLGIASIALEMNPLTSEPLRLAVLLGTEAITHSIVISALAFGGVTLLWELACVIAAADLLDTALSTKVIGRVRNAIGKVGLSKITHAKTNMLTDFAITLVMGSPATVILKHSQYPDRTAAQNRRLGYAISVGAAVIATLQGAAIVAGLWYPSVTTITIAVIIVGGSLTAYHYIKRYLIRSR